MTGTYAGRMTSRDVPVRKAARSPRTLVAALLLLSAATAVAAGFVFDTTTALLAAGAWAVLAGALAAVLLHGLARQVRRLWSLDRANLAGSYRTTAMARSREQRDFADTMATRLDEHRTRIVRLEAEIRQSSLRREELGNALADEQERTSALTAELEQVQEDLSHLRDALTASEAAEKRARAEVLAWEAQSRELA